MKACDQFDSLLSSFLEDETSAAETRFAEAHLTSCSRCRRQRERIERLIYTVHNLPRVEAAEGFTDAVLARTRGMEPAGMESPEVVSLVSRRPAWAVPLAAAAALTVVVLGVSQLPLGTGTSPETVQQTPAETPEEFVSLPVADTEPVPAETDAAHPEVTTLGGQENPGQSLGMMQDVYVVDAYELREPTGGGQPILTPVSGNDSPIKVTF